MELTENATEEFDVAPRYLINQKVLAADSRSHER